ncbi:MAG: DUF2330 domain-containing protein [Myxococcota bacterium]
MSEEHTPKRVGRTLTLLLLLAACAVAWGLTDAAPAEACLHLGQDGTISQSGQHGLILFKDGVEHLVLGVDARLEDTTPDKLAWVVPVPNVPDKYETVEGPLFQELHRWVRLEETSGLRVADVGGGAARDPLRVLRATRAGPYLIQPIQGKGPAAAAAMNGWMTREGFQPIPDETLRYYIERNWTFLAVRVVPNDEGFSQREGLPPLHMAFAAERPVYPLKLSTHMGRYAVRIYLVTEDAIPDEAFAAAVEADFHVAGDRNGRGALGSHPRLGARHGEFAPADAPETLQPLLADAGLADLPTLHLRVLHHRRLRGAKVAEWGEDLAFPPFEDAAAADMSVRVAEPAAPPALPTDVQAAVETAQGALEAAEAQVAGPAAPVAEPAGCGCRAHGRGDAGWFFVLLALRWTRRPS